MGRTRRKTKRVRTLAWEEAKRKRYADPRVADAMRRAGIFTKRQQERFLEGGENREA